jgi:hypothetical protein
LEQELIEAAKARPAASAMRTEVTFLILALMKNLAWFLGSRIKIPRPAFLGLDAIMSGIVDASE